MGGVRAVHGQERARWRVARRVRRGGVAAGLVVVVLAAAALGGCGGDDDRRLEALLQDPLADVDLPNARSARTTTSAGSTGPGVTSPAKVRTTFTVPAGTVDAAIAELAAQARAGGWSLEPRPLLGFSGEKTIDGYFSQAVIAGIEADGTVWVEIYTQDH